MFFISDSLLLVTLCVLECARLSSLVVYVTGDVGGPTLVTTQRLTSKRLADRGWIVHPRENRACMFDGGVLHGVIPGRGIPVTKHDHPPPPPSPVPNILELEAMESPGAVQAVVDRTGTSSGDTRSGFGEVGNGGDSAESRASPVGTVISADNGGSKKRKKKRKRSHHTTATPPVIATPSTGTAAAAVTSANNADGAHSGSDQPCHRGDDDKTSDGGSGGTNNSPSAPQLPAPAPERAGMRVTWMVAFWRDIQAREAVTEGRTPESPPSSAGAAQPFPGVVRDNGPYGKTIDRRGVQADVGGDEGGDGGRGAVGEPTWPALFRKKADGWGEGGEGRKGVPVVPGVVPQVWEDVDEAENRKMGVGVRRLKRLPEYDLCFQGF